MRNLMTSERDIGPGDAASASSRWDRNSTLLRINNFIVDCRTEDELLRAVGRALEEVVAFDNLGMTFFDAATQRYRFIAMAVDDRSSAFAVGKEVDVRQVQGGVPFDPARAFLLENLDGQPPDTPFAQRLFDEGFRSFLAVPLLRRGDSVGTLGLASRTAGAYGEQDVDFMQQVAGQVAIAVANLKAFDDIDALRRDASRLAERRGALLEINNTLAAHLTEDDVFQQVCRVLKRIVPCDNAGLAIYEADSDDVRIIALDGEFSSEAMAGGALVDRRGHVSGHEWKLDRPVVRNDLDATREYTFEHLLHASGLRSHCTVPLILEGKSLGSIGVGSRQPNQYSDAELTFLQEVANHVALAVANLESYDRIKELSERASRLAERRRALLEVNNAIITGLKREQLMKKVSEALRRLIAFDCLGVSVFDERKGKLVMIAVEGDVELKNFRVGWERSLEDSRSGEAFRTQRPLVRRDLTTERQYSSEQQLFEEGMRSMCNVPMIVQGKSIGAIGVTSVTPDFYDEHDAELLQEVAGQVGLAISNMQAYEEIAALKARLQAENVYLREEIRSEHNFDEIVGNSAPLLKTLAAVERVAATDSTALILGETGTGKELIARAIHDRSARKHRPLVKVNCGAITVGLVESELFGHVKGAFTGALADRDGRFKVAHGGTIFLDEVGELPPETQVKLLRVLQEQEFEPLGSNRTIRVDVRIIAATNRDLESAVRAGQFRTDLFYRLNVFPIQVPPLRGRKDDIPLLVAFFLERFGRRFGKRVKAVPDAAMRQLLAYDWPGNLRELQNVIERAVILSRGDVLEIEPLSSASNEPAAHQSVTPSSESSMPAGAPATLDDAQKRHIEAVLEKPAGSWRAPTAPRTS